MDLINTKAVINFAIAAALSYSLLKSLPTSGKDTATSNFLLLQTLNGSLFKLDLENSGEIIWSLNSSNSPLLSFFRLKPPSDIKHNPKADLILFLDINEHFVYKYHQSKQEIELLNVNSHEDENQEEYIENFCIQTSSIDLDLGENLSQFVKRDQNFLPRSADVNVIWFKRTICIKNFDETFCYNHSMISKIQGVSKKCTHS